MLSKSKLAFSYITTQRLEDLDMYFSTCHHYVGHYLLKKNTQNASKATIFVTKKKMISQAPLLSYTGDENVPR